MTFTIPIWLLWLAGVPLALAVLFCAAVGFMFIKGGGPRWPG